MALKTPLSLSLVLALAACTPNGAPPAEPPPGDAAPAPAQASTAPAAATPGTPASDSTAPAAAASDASGLAGYHWRLQSASDADGARIEALFPGDRVLTLDFGDGRVSVSGGCNAQGGSFDTAADSHLEIGQMTSTRKACPTPLMQADAAIAALLAQPQQWQVEESAPPRLRLVAADGSTTTWTGEATAQTRYGGEGETVFMEVAPQRIDCHHPMMPNYKCLQVREIRYDDKGVKQAPGEWQPFYGNIEGFEFREGERKVLRLKKFDKPEPLPADASSIAYVLDMVVESERVKQESP